MSQDLVSQDTKLLCHSVFRLFHCPIKGLAVSESIITKIETPDGQAIWWQCSACHGWHVIVAENQTGQLPSISGRGS
jgi:hypothetical protein